MIIVLSTLAFIFLVAGGLLLLDRDDQKLDRKARQGLDTERQARHERNMQIYSGQL